MIPPGELRIVLSWDTSIPDDPRAHLWLPAATPYHIFFARRGDLVTCPFASWDREVVSSVVLESITNRRQPPPGNGLRSMEARVMSLGGDEIRSSSGIGTTVIVTVPLTRRSALARPADPVSVDGVSPSFTWYLTDRIPGHAQSIHQH